MADNKTNEAEQSELMARVMQKMMQAESEQGLPIADNQYVLNKEGAFSYMAFPEGDKFYARDGARELRVATAKTFAAFTCDDGEEFISVERINEKGSKEYANNPEAVKALVKEWGITEEDLALQVRQYTNEALQPLMKHGDIDLRSGSMCNKRPFENQLILEAVEHEWREDKGYTVQDDLPYNKPDSNDLSPKR